MPHSTGSGGIHTSKEELIRKLCRIALDREEFITNCSHFRRNREFELRVQGKRTNVPTFCRYLQIFRLFVPMLLVYILLSTCLLCILSGLYSENFIKKHVQNILRSNSISLTESFYSLWQRNNSIDSSVCNFLVKYFQKYFADRTDHP